MSVKESEMPLGDVRVFHALHEWRTALRDFLQTSSDILKQHDVTPQQYQAMLAIKVAPDANGLTVSALANALRVRHNSTVMMVDQLCRKKLVRRTPCKEDHRRVWLQLTETGEALIQDLARAHREELQRIGPHVMDILEKASST